MATNYLKQQHPGGGGNPPHFFAFSGNIVKFNYEKKSERKINKSGQALVEFALVLPLSFLLVFGIVEFGRYLFLKNTATNGARQGARQAAVTPLNWDTNKRAAIFSAATSIYHGSTPWTVTINPDPPTASGQEVRVTVSRTFDSVVPNFIPIPTTISASAVMRYE